MRTEMPLREKLEGRIKRAEESIDRISATHESIHDARMNAYWGGEINRRPTSVGTAIRNPRRLFFPGAKATISYLIAAVRLHILDRQAQNQATPKK